MDFEAGIWTLACLTLRIVPDMTDTFRMRSVAMGAYLHTYDVARRALGYIANKRTRSKRLKNWIIYRKRPRIFHSVMQGNRKIPRGIQIPSLACS